jgi:hypothetical protein
MSDKVKVQGSLNRCLECLESYARQYNVTYQVTFGTSPRIYTVGTGRKVIPISFMWRYEYKEYDNSA